MVPRNSYFVLCLGHLVETPYRSRGGIRVPGGLAVRLKPDPPESEPEPEPESESKPEPESESESKPEPESEP